MTLLIVCNVIVYFYYRMHDLSISKNLTTSLFVVEYLYSVVTLFLLKNWH